MAERAQIVRTSPPERPKPLEHQVDPIMGKDLVRDAARLSLPMVDELAAESIEKILAPVCIRLERGELTSEQALAAIAAIAAHRRWLRDLKAKLGLR